MGLPAHIWYRHPKIALIVAGFGFACLIYLWLHLIFDYELLIAIFVVISFLIVYEFLIFVFVLKKKK